jgi:hypothetical protein
MTVYHDPSTNGQQELAAIRSEIVELAALAQELGGRIDAALEPAPTVPELPKLLLMQAGPLAAVLWRCLGRRKALVLRTRLTQIAELEDGRRQPNSSGRDHVMRPANGRAGNGHAATL